MSFHIVHLTEHAGTVYKDRGRLYYKSKEGVRSLPIENIRALIIAAKGISLSSALISALLEADCIILHLSNKYQPIGWSLPIPRTMHQDILEQQVTPSIRLREAIWQKILYSKIQNQRDILIYLELASNPLDRFVDGKLDEGSAARVYFGCFFRALEAIGQSRSRRHRGWLNALLNYGYSVLTSMIHRSIIVHGLLANIGVHHKARYRSYPLVYDIMEPLRPLVDGLVINWVQGWMALTEDRIPEGDAIKLFAKFIGNSLREFRVNHERYSLKLIDAMDIYVRSIAKSFLNRSPTEIWIPEINLEKLRNYRFEISAS